MIKHLLKRSFKSVDYAVSRMISPFIPERASLLTFLFHGIFLDEEEIKHNHVDPQQKITVAHFRQFLQFYREKGYEFVSPDTIMKGLNVKKRYVLITFDDGYFNNSYVVPVLEEFRVPAIFFVSPNYILRQKSFWWDVLYRERHRRGVPPDRISAEQNSLKVKTAADIERYLIDEFGEAALLPVCDTDRPFSVDEFRRFSASPFVHIGNHTADHAILVNYTPKGVREQIINAQYELYRLTGKKPTVISYPNGSYNATVLKVTRELGLTLGITVDPRKNYLPFNIKDADAVKLGRFILVGDSAINVQCEMFKFEFSLYSTLKHILKKNKH